MNKVLVTGGCGFIGSNLVDALIEKDYEVNVMDNLSSESEVFYHNEKANYYHSDITNFESVLEAMKDCEIVFHLAAESRIGTSLENPAKSCHVNFVGTCNILQAARQIGVKSVVYSSSSACYGLSNSLPQKETDKIDNLNPYSVSKYAAEDLCKMYHNLWGLNTVSLRYFNVYGERMPSKGQYAPVVGVFLRQKSQNQPLTVVGDGLQSRDFVYVKDVVSANILASSTEHCYGNIYNIGSGKSYTVLEIAKSISTNYIHIDQRPGESRHTKSDYSRFHADSGWSPKTELSKWIESQLIK
jgi:UDP-glucose 4-epimerase